MTMGHGISTSFTCPRCGGRMYKPAGSSFYWHADNNHPRCDITNIADVSHTNQETPGSDVPPTPARQQQRKGR